MNESHRKFSLVLTKNHLILLDENNKLQSYTRCQETISPKIEHLKISSRSENFHILDYFVLIISMTNFVFTWIYVVFTNTFLFHHSRSFAESKSKSCLHKWVIWQTDHVSSRWYLLLNIVVRLHLDTLHQTPSSQFVEDIVQSGSYSIIFWSTMGPSVINIAPSIELK